MTSMADLMEELLQGGTLDKISSQIGADPAQTQQAIRQALPMLLGGLEREASDPEGARGLQQALAEDQHATVLDDLDAYLSGQRHDRATDGAGILRHVLGDRQETAAQALGQRAGLSGGNIMQLLAMLAPIVMGMLSKKSGGGGGGFPDLGQILGQERAQAQEKAPDIGDVLGEVFGEPVASTAGPSRDARRGGGIVDAITDLLGRRD